MPSHSYPVGADLQAFLEGHQLDVTAYLDQLGEKTDAGIAAFEAAVGGKMLAESPASLRKFAVPVDGAALEVDWLAAEPETITYTPAGGTPETLTLDTDYFCLPNNAIAKGKPIELLEFTSRWRWYGSDPSLRRAIQVTGFWGYSTELRADVRQAMLMKAAGLLWTSITHGGTGGVLGKKEGDASIDYGVESWNRLINAWTGLDGMSGEFGRVVAQYKRMGF